MTDDPVLKLAEDELEGVLKRKSELETFIDQYRRLKRRAVPVTEVEVVPRALTQSSTATIVTTAKALLRQSGRPLPLGNLFDLVTAQGIHIGGKIPKNNLGAKLSADPELETITGFGWWFKGQPWPGMPDPVLSLSASTVENGPEAEASRPNLNGTAGVYPVAAVTHTAGA